MSGYNCAVDARVDGRSSLTLADSDSPDSGVAGHSINICPSGHFCPAGSSAPTACPAGKFQDSLGSKSEVECKLCPLGYVCPSGSSMPQQQVPKSTVAPFKVALAVGLPISRSDFDASKHQTFIASLASAAQVPVGSVNITGIQDSTRRASGIKVDVEMAATSADSAAAIASNLTPESINSQLAKAGLPECRLLEAPQVQEGAAPTEKLRFTNSTIEHSGSGGNNYNLIVACVGLGVLVPCALLCVVLIHRRSTRKPSSLESGTPGVQSAGL